MDPQLLELIEGGDGGEEVEVILKLRPGEPVPPHVRVVTRFGDIATSRVRRDRVAATWGHPAVLSAKAPRLVAAEVEPPPPMDRAPSEVIAAPAQELRAHGTGAAGRGVIVGIVDWGLDVAHQNFRRADGSTRVLAMWDQDARQASGARPAYGYGTVHTAAGIDQALRAADPYAALGYHPADSDDFGDGAHGTHVCDIAAGNGRAAGSVPGMAPEADIVFVHLAARGTGGLASLGDTARILEALDFVRVTAGDRPWVVNLSVGRCGGPHTGLTLVEQGIDALLSERPGRAVAQSAGNYFASAGHAAGQLRPGERRTLTWLTDRADVSPNELEIWYPGRDAIVVEIAFPSGELAARVALGARAALHAAGRECGRVYHRRHDPSNGDHHVDIFLDPATAPAGAWRVTLIGDDVVDGRFDAWVERDSGCASCQSRFDARDAVPLRTTGTIANGFRAVAVGAYDPRDAGLALAPFSSCGPTRDGRQKPDLVAPGVRIIAARSAPRAGTWTPVTVKSGTSMAAPHVTGTIACMLEVARRPLWIHETRRLLMGSARGVNVAPADAARFGSGYLDPARSIAGARELGSAVPATRRMDASPREVAMTSETSYSDDFGGERLAVLLEGEAGAHEEAGGASSAAPCACAEFDHTLLEEAAVGATGDGARLVSQAEAALHAGGRSIAAASIVEAALADAGDLDAWPGARGECCLTTLFDALTGRGPPSLRHRVADRFEVIAAPRGRPAVPFASGDIYLRRLAGEPGLVHAGVLATGAIVERDAIAALGWGAERSARGGYALVVEGGAFPHCTHAPFARRMLDEHGLVPTGQIVLRVRWPSRGGDGAAHGDGFAEASPSPVASRQAAGSKRAPVRARILWPALGFPAMIAPRDRPVSSQMLDADATRCVCVLLLSSEPYLATEDAARYLRYVPWQERGRRHIPPGQVGAFAPNDLAIRNDVTEPRLGIPGASDRFGALVAFGGDRDGEHGVAVTLAKYVRDFYRDQGLAHLHEIRVSEAASGRLRDGLYHLFWNDETADETGPSGEMDLLLRRWAGPRREALRAFWERTDQPWEKVKAYLVGEYEYEYGVLHAPHASPPSQPKTLAMRPPRAEVLHPLRVDRQHSGPLRIGHITDTHVDVRADVYEENLKQENVRARYHPRWTATSYNNWNRSFVRCYGHARQDADILLLTGDLIDYGRGHFGVTERARLGDDEAYHTDRNWLLFYYLLASGDAYSKPVYTILGNHDWRLNPYPPFAVAGAPSPRLLINNYADFTEDEQKDILRLAHGPGHERAFSYFSQAKSKTELLLEQPRASAKALWRMIGQTKTMDETHTPTETTVESVAWYLLSINPFLDYMFTLPSQHRILMLDWAEDENVLFPIVERGESWPYMVWQAGTASDPGPKAMNCLTGLQKRLVEDFAAGPGVAKIVGIHAPPIGPYPDWFDGDLLQGRKIYDGKSEPRGPTNYATRKPDGSIEKWNGHPVFAIQPPNGQAGMVADYGSLEKERDWFIRTLGESRSGVRLVFSGHIHRNGLYVVHEPAAGTRQGPAVAGQRLVRGVVEHIVRGARPPAVAKVPEGMRGPLYVNTTSAGPRGNSHPRKGQDAKVDPGYAHVAVESDGTIQLVEFRPMGLAVQQRPVVSAPRHGTGVLVG